MVDIRFRPAEPLRGQHINVVNGSYCQASPIRIHNVAAASRPAEQASGIDQIRSVNRHRLCGWVRTAKVNSLARRRTERQIDGRGEAIFPNQIAEGLRGKDRVILVDLGPVGRDSAARLLQVNGDQRRPLVIGNRHAEAVDQQPRRVSRVGTRRDRVGNRTDVSSLNLPIIDALNRNGLRGRIGQKQDLCRREIRAVDADEQFAAAGDRDANRSARSCVQSDRVGVGCGTDRSHFADRRPASGLDEPRAWSGRVRGDRDVGIVDVEKDVADRADLKPSGRGVDVRQRQ